MAAHFPIYQLMDAFEAFTHGNPDVKPQHRSLYYYLVSFARKRGGTMRYNLPYDLGMAGSAIGSWKTYNEALANLSEWGFIAYTPGANRYKVPVLELLFCNPSADQAQAYQQFYRQSTDNPTGDMNNMTLGLVDLRTVGVAGATAPAPASINPSPEQPPVPLPAQTSPQIAILPEKPAKRTMAKPKSEPKPEPPKMLFADCPLADPAALLAHLAAKGYADADATYYRRKIADWSAGENADGRPVQRSERGWATTVTGWLDRDKAKGCLMRQGATNEMAQRAWRGQGSQTERRQQALNDAAALREALPNANPFTSTLGYAPPKG